jgi:hypothetical protein
LGVRLSVIHQPLVDSSPRLLEASILFKCNPVRLLGLEGFAGLRALPKIESYQNSSRYIDERRAKKVLRRDSPDYVS